MFRRCLKSDIFVFFMDFIIIRILIALNLNFSVLWYNLKSPNIQVRKRKELRLLTKTGCSSHDLKRLICFENIGLIVSKPNKIKQFVTLDTISTL